MSSSTRFALLEILVPGRNWAWRQPGNDWINERRTYHTMTSVSFLSLFLAPSVFRLIVLRDRHELVRGEHIGSTLPGLHRQLPDGQRTIKRANVCLHFNNPCP